jgi:phosphatidylglycerophosphatase A
MQTNNNPAPATVFKSPVHFLAFGFGSGLSPVAPGTMGTLAAVPVYWLMVHYLSPGWYLLSVILLLILGVWLCHVSAEKLGVHDHPGIVWDEIVGYLITMFAAPAGWMWVLIGFVLFRLLDVWKPWPIRYVDKKISGGWGIMLDDILAGVFAWVLLQVTVNSIM